MSRFSRYSSCTEEGDLRLVDQRTIANWEVGRPEVFFEGSWSQICGIDFDPADADVACRQLGFGMGAVGPLTSDSTSVGRDQFSPKLFVYPEVALRSPGCNGTEASLLDCPRTMQPVDSDYVHVDYHVGDCFDSNGPGLTLACVRESEPGPPLLPVILPEPYIYEFMHMHTAAALGASESREEL